MANFMDYTSPCFISKSKARDALDLETKPAARTSKLVCLGTLQAPVNAAPVSV
jgi:hypothetical protein